MKLPYSSVKRSTKPLRRGKRPRAKRGDLRWEAVREVCCARAKGQCEQCGRAAPLHGDEYPAGEGAHIERRWKSKAGKYDPANVRWLCGGMNGCHRREHRAEEHGLCARRPKEV